jgi:hypothetical protein
MKKDKLVSLPHRKRTAKIIPRIVDIKAEIPEAQLAAIGAMALAFNEVEAAIDRLFFVVTDLAEPLQLEISTRIGGLDGKVQVIPKGAALFLEREDLGQLQELLGKGVFGTLKDYRDGVIHARHIDVKTGIGTKVARRAQVFDYWLKEPSLNAAYKILVVVGKELDEGVTLFASSKALKQIQGDDPNIKSLESKVSESRHRFQGYRKERQGLPQIPKFPTESELREADFQAQQIQTARLMADFQPWMYPQFRKQFSPALWNYIQNNQPLGSPPALLHSGMSTPDDKKDK